MKHKKTKPAKKIGSGRKRGQNWKPLEGDATAELMRSDCGDLPHEVVNFVRMLRDLKEISPVLLKKFQGIDDINLRQPLLVVMRFLQGLKDGLEAKTFLEVARAYELGADKGPVRPDIPALIYSAADASSENPDGINAADVARRIEAWNLPAKHIQKPDTIGKKLKSWGFKNKGKGAPRGW